MKASKTVTTMFAAATLVGAISLAYAQASNDMQPAEPTQEQQLQPTTDVSPAPATDVSPAPLTPAQDATGTPATPAETTTTAPAAMPAQATTPAQAPAQAPTYDNNTPATGNMPAPDNSAPLISERAPRADRN